jgi:hypothetical protein
MRDEPVFAVKRVHMLDEVVFERAVTAQAVSGGVLQSMC